MGSPQHKYGVTGSNKKAPGAAIAARIPSKAGPPIRLLRDYPDRAADASKAIEWNEFSCPGFLDNDSMAQQAKCLLRSICSRCYRVSDRAP